MMDNMLNKLQNHSDEEEAMRLRMEILNKLSPEEQQKIKKGFCPQMRLTPFQEAQIQRRITELSKNAIHINAGWDLGRGTDEQQDEFHEDFLGEPQQLEIRILNKMNKKHKPRKHWKGVGQSPWTIVQLNELSGTAREGPDQSNTKLRSRQPTS
ncbi:MAG: hypothetical protein EZS28_020318, partial [Streblomastix strix]